MIKTALQRFKALFIRVHELHNGLDNFPYLFRRAEYEKLIFGDTPSGVTDRDYCGRPIIVSLTSYGRRLLDVCFTIESIMQQSWKPNRIILWLAPDDIVRPLPEALIRQQKRGLEIRQTPNLGSYKKLLPALKEMPDDVIITVDDDVLYDFDLLERLIKAHISEPDKIVSTKSYRVEFEGNGRLKPYKNWSRHNDSPAEADGRTFSIGCGGILYPPGCFASEVTDTSLCLKLCPKADDVWFNIMARRKGTKVTKILTRHPNGCDYIDNRNMLNTGLAQHNVEFGGNDTQIRNVLDYFKLEPKSLFNQ